VYVTENGTSLPDAPGADGVIHDPVRVRYIARHAAAVRQAIADGADVRGYFLWSFMDNFEWGFGFTKRFGMTWVDYETQDRILKDSGRWYSRTARENGFPCSDADAAP
jgi:beta-glucosidase